MQISFSKHQTLLRGIAAFAVVAMLASGCASNEISASDAYGDSSDAGSGYDDDTSEASVPSTESGGVQGGSLGDCDPSMFAQVSVEPPDSLQAVGPPLARYLIENGTKIEHTTKKLEFFNYYSFDQPVEEGEQAGISAQLDELDEGTFELQVGLSAAGLTKESRGPANLVLLVDTSFTATGTGIQRMKQVCVSLAGSLKEGDVISIASLTANGTALAGHQVSSDGDLQVIGHCNALATGGTRDVGGAITGAYDLVRGTYSSDAVNAVVLVTEGGWTVSQGLADFVRDQAASQLPVKLVGITVESDYGPAAYDGSTMKALTHAGRGVNLFADSSSEALSVLGDDLTRNLFPAARDVELSMVLPPTLEVTSFFDRTLDPDPKGSEDAQLRAGDTMVFRYGLRSCDAEQLDLLAPMTFLAEYRDPWTGEGGEVELETSLGELLGQSNELLKKGRAVSAYAEALAPSLYLEAQEISALVDEAVGHVQDAIQANPYDEELAEMERLLTEYKDII